MAQSLGDRWLFDVLLPRPRHLARAAWYVRKAGLASPQPPIYRYARLGRHAHPSRFCRAGDGYGAHRADLRNPAKATARTMGIISVTLIIAGPAAVLAAL